MINYFTTTIPKIPVMNYSFKNLSNNNMMILKINQITVTISPIQSVSKKIIS